MARMEQDMPWFRELSAEERSWVGLIVQAGIRGFVDWFRTGETALPAGSPLASAVFGAAPRALTGVISLQQTVALIRLSIGVVESHVDEFLAPEDLDAVHGAVLLYGREVAFATAEVYARAAEVRGAWDARLEALVVDSVLRSEPDEAVLSRASALGWAGRGGVTVVLGAVPARRTETDIFDGVRRDARAAGMDALCATQGDRLVVVLGGVGDPHKAAEVVADRFGPGPVVVGPVTDDLSAAHLSARAALSAHRAASGWPEAPRPVHSDDLLPERVLAGDGHARRHLVDEVFLPADGGQGHPDRDPLGVLRERVVDGGDRTRPVRASQHRALPAAPDRRPHRLLRLRPPARPDAADGAGAGSPVGPSDRPQRLRPELGSNRFLSGSYKERPDSYVSAGGEDRACCSAEWSPCSSSSRPGRAPRRPAS